MTLLFKLMVSEKEHTIPIPAIDAIIHNNLNQVLLIKRKHNPYKNHLSLPGGFVNHGEKVEEALKREIKDKVSLNIEPLEILGVYSDPIRDPRDHIMSIVFICLNMDDLKGENDDNNIAEIHWINLTDLGNYNLAFDHNMILQDYCKWRDHGSTYWSLKIR
ncbi:MAG: NUDIX hydrolase [Thermoproteota archaeon]|nr:NUDIX hydrolase [Thermoproteota archaeon]